MSKDKHRAKARRMAILRHIGIHGRIVHSKRQRYEFFHLVYKDKDLQRLIKEGYVQIVRKPTWRRHIKRTVAVPTWTWRNR